MYVSFSGGAYFEKFVSAMIPICVLELAQLRLDICGGSHGVPQHGACAERGTARVAVRVECICIRPTVVRVPIFYSSIQYYIGGYSVSIYDTGTDYAALLVICGTTGNSVLDLL